MQLLITFVAAGVSLLPVHAYAQEQSLSVYAVRGHTLVGTAFLAKHADKVYYVTAKHVIDALRKKGGFGAEAGIYKGTTRLVSLQDCTLLSKATSEVCWIETKAI